MAVVRRGNFDRAVLPDGHLWCELYLRRHQECLRQGASDIRFGIDIRGGVDVTFMPADDVEATDAR